MARGPQSGSEPVLLAARPASAAPSNLRIAHVQLRNLVVCPKDRGVVWYVSMDAVVEQDVRVQNSVPHILAQLPFTPVCLDAVALEDGNVLLAAGGQDTELFLALYSFMSKTIPSPRVSGSSSEPENSSSAIRSSEEIWNHCSRLTGSINNSVMLYVPPIAPSTAHDYYTLASGTAPPTKPLPRLVVSNNDCSIKVFEVSTATGGFGRRGMGDGYVRCLGRLRREDETVQRIQRIGLLKLPVPVNHTSISPDGSTLLSCGDSPSIHLHRFSSWAPGIPLKSEHIASYTIPASLGKGPPSPPPISAYLPYAFVDGQWTAGGGPPTSCFSTSWSSDGSKFAVASQEGVVVVWDVRSGEPLPRARWETARREKEMKKSPDPPRPPPRTTEISPVTHPHLFPSMAMGVMDEREFDRAAAAMAAAASVSPYSHSPSAPIVPTSNVVAGPYGDNAQLEALYMTDPYVWVGERVQAPAWGVRNVKFSKNQHGHEVLVFTEHASLVHIIDAETFEKHDIIRIPHIRASSSSSLASLSMQPASDPDQAFHAALAAERRRIYSPYEGNSLVDMYRLLTNENEQHLLSPPDSIPPDGRLGSRRATFSASNALSRSPEPMTVDENAASEMISVGRTYGPLPPSRRQQQRASRGNFRVPPSRSAIRSAANAFAARSDSLLYEDSPRTVYVEVPPFDDEETQRDVQQTFGVHGFSVIPAASSLQQRPPSVLAQGARRLARRHRQSLQPRVTMASETEIMRDLAGMPRDTARRQEVEEPVQQSTEMEVEEEDESDTECLPPVLPPPAPLPPPSISMSPTTHHPSAPPAPSTDSSLPPISPHGNATPSAVQSLPPCQELIESTDRLDIGGVAFDPSGRFLYIATVDGITEWAVKGADVKWYSSDGWL